MGLKDAIKRRTHKERSQPYVLLCLSFTWRFYYVRNPVMLC